MAKWKINAYELGERKMAKKIFLTGGTGFVGSNIAYRFLRQGDNVYFLARPKAGIEPGKRIENAIKVIDPSFHLEQYKYEILEGDITNPFCGIDKKKTSLLNNKIDEFWHAAASFSFDELEAEMTKKVNVDGTHNVLDFATTIGSPPFHYISTAYIVGNFKGCFFESDLNKYQGFKNPYEKSKFEAEFLVHNYTGKFSIYRLAIVVGDSYSGQTLTFTGFYRFLRSFALLRERLINRIQRGKDSYPGKGIRINADNVLILSLMVPCSYESTINLIPINWAADTVTLLASRQEPSGKTFHITHPTPPKIKWAMEICFPLLGIDGLRIESPGRYLNFMNNLDSIYDDAIMISAQKKIHEGIKDYFPYVCYEPQFDSSNVKETLSYSYTSPPPITEEIFKIILDYASRMRFKRNIHGINHNLITEISSKLHYLPIHFHHSY